MGSAGAMRYVDIDRAWKGGDANLGMPTILALGDASGFVAGLGATAFAARTVLLVFFERLLACGCKRHAWGDSPRVGDTSLQLLQGANMLAIGFCKCARDQGHTLRWPSFTPNASLDERQCRPQSGPGIQLTGPIPECPRWCPTHRSLGR